MSVLVAERRASHDTGQSLSRDDALELIEQADLDGLLSAASRLRDRGKGRIVSYSKKVFIPLTHLCRDYCGYCTFRADPKPGVAAVHDAGRSARRRRSRRAGRLQGSAVLARRSAGTHLSRSARVPAQARLRAHARLSRRDDRAGAEQHRSAAACQSRRDGRRRSRPLARVECQPRADAGECFAAAEAAGRRALARARQGAGVAAAHDRRGRTPEDRVHDRDPDRHRRNAGRARRTRCLRSSGCTMRTATFRKC